LALAAEYIGGLIILSEQFCALGLQRLGVLHAAFQF
jgi:hypothetical protein